MEFIRELREICRYAYFVVIYRVVIVNLFSIVYSNVIIMIQFVLESRNIEYDQDREKGKRMGDRRKESYFD